MTYVAGIFGSSPSFTCDSCGVVRRIEGLPPEWMLREEPKPPGWRRFVIGERIKHVCKACVAKGVT